MASKTLTDTAIRALKPPKDKNLKVMTGGCPGLYVDVSHRTGEKFFRLQYRFDNKPHLLTFINGAIKTSPASAAKARITATDMGGKWDQDFHRTKWAGRPGIMPFITSCHVLEACSSGGWFPPKIRGDRPSMQPPR